MATKFDPDEFQKDIQYRQLYGADRYPIGRRKGKFWKILILLIMLILALALLKPDFLHFIGH